MFDLGKLELNRNFFLYLNCPIVENNLGLTSVSKKRNRKTQEKNGKEKKEQNKL